MSSPIAADRIQVILAPIGDRAELAARWRDLEERADCPVFLSWAWIGTWLEHLPPGRRPYLLDVRLDGGTVGLAILCRRSRRLLPDRTLWARWWFLHESGCPDYDRLTVEHNGVLADRAHRGLVMSHAIGRMTAGLPSFDRLSLGGLAPAADAEAMRRAGAAGLIVRRRRVEPTYSLKLEGSGDDYLASLGRSTRSAVRRAMRLYEERGPLNMQVAETASVALDWFDQLVRLHMDGWRARGQPGAFATPRIRAFHEGLIATGVPAGLVRICRIGVDGEAIGFLYNLAWRGEVFSYQSGLIFETDNRLKPGLVSHVLAIQDAIARGDRIYDFGAGNAGHKEHLAKQVSGMSWVLLARENLPERLRHACEQGARRLRDRMNRQDRMRKADAHGCPA